MGVQKQLIYLIKHISTWEGQAALSLLYESVVLVTVWPCDWAGQIPDTSKQIFFVVVVCYQ